MGQSGLEHCPGGGYERQWLQVRPTIGRMTISGPEDDAVLEPLMDQPVLAQGFFARERPPVASDEAVPRFEPCLPAQMRSDWRFTPRGLLIERDPAPEHAHMRIDAVRRLHELQARHDGDHVVVTFINPTPVPLAGVELRVHYEGCFGKPGTKTERSVVGELGLGAQVSARMPALARRASAPEGRDELRAHSVQVVGRSAERTIEFQHTVVLDLDVPLATLGAAVECPER